MVVRGRQLNTLTVNSTSELFAAISDRAVNQIVMMAGTYNVASTLSIRRPLTIKAHVAGSVVISSRLQKVFIVQSFDGADGEAQLIGLNITGGGVELGGWALFVGSLPF